MLASEEDCTINTDLIFVIDSSGSIGYDNYEQVLQFVYDSVEPLDIGPDKNRVGLIIFSYIAEVVFSLNTYWNKEELLQAINQTEYIKGGTNTSGALMMLIDEGFTRQAGARLDSQTVLRIAVVLTDGRSNNFDQTIEAAKRVHAFRPAILVYVVGVTDNVNQNELEAIATGKEFIDNLTQFDASQFRQSQEENTYQICNRASIPTDLECPFNGTLTKQQVTRFQIPVPEEGLTVRLCVETGHILLYGSTSVPNPGEAFYDYKLECIHRCTGCEIFVDVPVVDGGGSREAGYNGTHGCQAMGNETVSLTDTTLYIVLEGLKENNTFSLENNIGDTTTPIDATSALLGYIIPVTILVILLTAVVLLALCYCAGRKYKESRAITEDVTEVKEI